jgi:pyruvate dehydrogenase E2 component (dihydrolipoamide acetyltransferase)
MAHAFKLPDLGEGIHEAETQEVLANEDATVEEGDSVLVVETDKAMVEVPSPYTDTIAEIRVAVGDILQVGDVLITLNPFRLPPPRGVCPRTGCGSPAGIA